MIKTGGAIIRLRLHSCHSATWYLICIMNYSWRGRKGPVTEEQHRVYVFAWSLSCTLFQDSMIRLTHPLSNTDYILDMWVIMRSLNGDDSETERIKWSHSHKVRVMRRKKEKKRRKKKKKKKQTPRIRLSKTGAVLYPFSISNTHSKSI